MITNTVLFDPLSLSAVKVENRFESNDLGKRKTTDN